MIIVTTLSLWLDIYVDDMEHERISGYLTAIFKFIKTMYNSDTSM